MFADVDGQKGVINQSFIGPEVSFICLLSGGKIKIFYKIQKKLFR